MAYEGWLSFGGNEVVNSERLRGYAETSDCPPNWFRGDRCKSLADALSDDPYSYANIPLAPWYDPSLADVSSRFMGVQGLSIQGLDDSTRSASSTEGIDDGGTLGRTRKGMRNARVRASLIAQGRDALEYGVSWVNAALDPGACGQHGSRCGTTDLEYFADCPPERVDVDDFTEWEEAARNLVTNPSFEAVGEEVALYQNLFQNPSFAAGSGTVEVRRNYFQRPRPSLTGMTGWVLERTNMTGQAVLEGLELTQNDTGVGTWMLSPINAERPTSAAGELWSVAFVITNTGPSSVRLAAQLRNTTAAIQQVGPVVTIHPGQQATLRLDGWAPGVGSLMASVRSDDVPVGARIVVHDAPLLEKSVVTGPPFAPGLPYSDADLTPSWVGAEYGSVSVLTGVPVAGISTRMCLAIRSSKFGGSMRLIPTSATDNNSYAEAQPYPGLIAQQTLMATVHLEAPLTGAIGPRSRQLYSATPLQGTPAAPNAAGSYPLRTVQTPTSQGRVIFYHGGLLGSGDVYWTQAGLFVGDYSGPWFDGSTSPDPDWGVRWSGAPNNSNSMAYGFFPEGWTRASITPVMQSSQWASSGDRSIRIDSGIAYQMVTVDPGAVTTIQARARFAGQMLSDLTSQSVATEDGEILQITATGIGTATIALYPILNENQTEVIGSGWWDDVIVTTGNYSGGYFDGDSTPEGDVENVRYVWDGEPNTSESIMETRDEYIRPQTDEEYAKDVDPLRRFLHDVSVTSGPILIDIFESKSVKGLWGATFEWTITSERPWIYSPTRPVDLPITQTVVMESTPFNLVPYPSMALAGDVVSVSTNLATNPSVETNISGWGARRVVNGVEYAGVGSQTPPARSTAVAASGVASYLTRADGYEPNATDMDYTMESFQVVDLSEATPGARFSFSIWGHFSERVVSAGQVRVSLGAYIEWLPVTGETPISTVDIGETTTNFSGETFSAKALVKPPTATRVRVVLSGRFTAVAGGDMAMQMFADALAVTVP